MYSLINLKVCFSLKIPKDIPPSYRGSLIRYTFYVATRVWSIDEQGVETTALLRVPFTVYNPLAGIM